MAGSVKCAALQSKRCRECEQMLREQTLHLHKSVLSGVAVLEPRSDHAMASNVRSDGPHSSMVDDF